MKKNLVQVFKGISLIPIFTSLLIILVFVIHKLTGDNFIWIRKALMALMIFSTYTLVVFVPVFIWDRVKFYFNVPIKVWAIYLIGLLFFAIYLIVNPFGVMNWLFD